MTGCRYFAASKHSPSLLALGAKRHDELVSFHERDGQQFVLLSDLWRLAGTEGDPTSALETYSATLGDRAPQNILLKTQPPRDALVSRAMATWLVEDRLSNGASAFFDEYTVAWLFDEACRAFHGPAIIMDIFERVAATPEDQPNRVGLQMEIDRVAQAMLRHWGYQRNGFPTLDRGQTAFLRRLTMRQSDSRRAVHATRVAARFFDLNAQEVAEKLRREPGDVFLRSS